MLNKILGLTAFISVVSSATIGHGLNNPMLLEAHKTFNIFNLPSLTKTHQNTTIDTTNMIPCTCGVFLSGQFKKGSPDPPNGDPAFINEIEQVFPCNYAGQKLCQSKCLEAVSFLSENLIIRS